MAMTDPIADMLTRIRNACGAENKTVDIPSSRLKIEITRTLKREGFIEDFKLIQGDEEVPRGNAKERSAKGKKVRLCLKYDEHGSSVIRGITRISTPGKRVYAGIKEMPRPLRGMGVAIISTSRGVLTDAQCREERLGGEVLCYLW